MTNVYYDYDDLEDYERVTQKKCKCGHKLYQHAFTDNTMSYFHGYSHFLRVSQCVMCGDCKEFEFA